MASLTKDCPPGCKCSNHGDSLFQMHAKRTAYKSSSPLWIASSNGNVDIVNLLIEADGNVNQARTDSGVTPLFIASQNGIVALVKILIKAGANIIIVLKHLEPLENLVQNIREASQKLDGIFDLN